MNDILNSLQNNSFLVSLVVAFLVSVGSTYLKFRVMSEKIHSLSKRLGTIEEERIAHIESIISVQGNTLSTIEERTKNMSVALSRIENHLLDAKK